MDDEVLVGVAHGLAGLGEERQRVGDAEVPFGAVGGHRRTPVDVLHDQKGRTLLRRPGVEQAGDVRVVEAGQDTPLGKEAPDGFRGRSGIAAPA